MLPSQRLLLISSLVTTAAGHSWVACTDYRGDVNIYEEDKCYGYPRLWSQRGTSALTATADGYHIGADTGYNYMPGDPCQSALDLSGYTDDYPKATYEAGQVYCLAWPTKNHAAASCTNAFIPDTSTRLFHSDPDVTEDPTQAEFKANNVNNALLDEDCDADDIDSDECQLGFEKHDSGSMDCKGFQRAPRFCDNTDRALGTGCFVAPSTTGSYVFQWYWEFNAGSPYSTCFDVDVVDVGSGNGKGGTSGTPSEASDAFGGACTNNAVEMFDTDTEDSNPSPTTAPTAIADDRLSGSDFIFTSVPDIVDSLSKGDSFEISFSYTAESGITFIGDLVSQNHKTRYGTAQLDLDETDTITSATLDVVLTSSISDGSSLILRGLLVPSEFADDDDSYLDYCLSRSEKEVCFSSDNTQLDCLGDDDDDDGSGTATVESSEVVMLAEGMGAGLVAGMVIVLAGLRIFTGKNPMVMGSENDATPSKAVAKTWTDENKDKKDLI